MVDEQRADNRRLEFILDDQPFDLGVKVKCSVRAAVSADGLLVGGARLSEAKGVWVVFEADESLTLIEVNEALTPIQNWVSSDTEVVFGAYVDPAMGQEFRVTILATGHEKFGFPSPPHYHARTDRARVSGGGLK